MSVWRFWGTLGAWLLLCFATAFAGARATVSAGAFYQQLQQPVWAPPGFVFGPVWSLLYALMAVAAWRVSLRPDSRRRLALGFFVAQLLVNGLWSWLFFAWQLGAAALIDIVALWLLLGICIGLFRRCDRVAAWLLVPCWAWVSFAGVLNYSLWQLNPGVLS